MWATRCCVVKLFSTLWRTWGRSVDHITSVISVLRSLLDSLFSQSKKIILLHIIFFIIHWSRSEWNVYINWHVLQLTLFLTILFLPASVIVRYNNKTYRIDDIAWDQTPSNTFKRGEADISFKDYYKNVSTHKAIFGSINTAPCDVLFCGHVTSWKHSIYSKSGFFFFSAMLMTT